MSKRDLAKPLESMRLTVRDITRPMRVDSYLALRLPMYSRHFHRKNIDAGRVIVNRKTAKASKKVVQKDKIIVHLPPEILNEERPEDIPAELIYEDDYMMAVNKEAGYAVHPAGKHLSNTILNAVAYTFRNDEKVEPHLVHRLDKDTSGVMLFAKNLAAKQALYQLFEKRDVKKEYRAVVSVEGKNHPEKQGLIDKPLFTDKGRSPHKVIVDGERGKPSRTGYQVVEKLSGRHYLLSLDLLTGRQHQIRAHLESEGWPIIGDERYGGEMFFLKRQALHAYQLCLVHPFLKKPVEITAPVPGDIREAVQNIREHAG